MSSSSGLNSSQVSSQPRERTPLRPAAIVPFGTVGPLPQQALHHQSATLFLEPSLPLQPRLVRAPVAAVVVFQEEEAVVEVEVGGEMKPLT